MRAEFCRCSVFNKLGGDIRHRCGRQVLHGVDAVAHPPLESSCWLSSELLLSLELSLDRELELSLSLELSLDRELLLSLLLEFDDVPLLLEPLPLVSGVLGELLPEELPASSSGEGVLETPLSMSVTLPGEPVALPMSPAEHTGSQHAGRSAQLVPLQPSCMQHASMHSAEPAVLSGCTAPAGLTSAGGVRPAHGCAHRTASAGRVRAAHGSAHRPAAAAQGAKAAAASATERSR